MEKVKVLVVDDSRVSCAMLSDILSRTNFEVCAIARNAAEAVELYKEHHPTVVTMDMNLPDADGLECSRRIKALNVSAKIVMISAMKDASLISNGRSIGISSFLQKPVDANELIDTLLFLCQGKVGTVAILRETYIKAFAKVIQQGIVNISGLTNAITIDVEERPYIEIDGVAIVIGLTGYPVGRAIIYMNKDVMMKSSAAVLGKNVEDMTEEEACEVLEEAANVTIGRGVSVINDIYKDKEMRITPPGILKGNSIRVANSSITSFCIKAKTKVGEMYVNIGFAEEK